MTIEFKTNVPVAEVIKALERIDPEKRMFMRKPGERSLYVARLVVEDWGAYLESGSEAFPLQTDVSPGVSSAVA